MCIHILPYAKERGLAVHVSARSDDIRGLIAEDLKRLEVERLEVERLTDLRSGKGIPLTTDAWQRLKAEAAQRIQQSWDGTGFV